MQMEMKRMPWQKCLDKIDYKIKINKREKKKNKNTLHNNQVITPTRRQNNYKYI